VASSAKFKLPDIRGRVIVGKGSSPFDTLNNRGGTETVTLDISQIPSHDHSVGSVSVSGTGSVQTTVQSTGTFTGNETRTKKDMVDSEVAKGEAGLFGHFHITDSLSGSQYQATYEQNGMKYSGYHQFGGRQSDRQGSDNFHSHSFTPSGSISVTSVAQSSLTLTPFNTQATTTGAKGSGNSHNNLQPYIVLNYFIKAKKESKQYASTLVSDIRVKRNITILNPEKAINAIRLLKPKQYEYIDKNMSEFTHHIGLIAQEAKLYIPESVQTKREFIPNIYSMAKLTISVAMHGYDKYNNAILTSLQYPITNIIKKQLLETESKSDDTNSNIKLTIKDVKLKMFNKSKRCFYVCCVESIDDYNLVVEPLDAVTTENLLSDDYFIYGQEIEDYHYMNNDAVFSTLISAFQALDSKCKEQENLLAAIISKYNLNI
jgi:microcystin-dependent protein